MLSHLDDLYIELLQLIVSLQPVSITQLSDNIPLSRGRVNARVKVLQSLGKVALNHVEGQTQFFCLGPIISEEDVRGEVEIRQSSNYKVPETKDKRLANVSPEKRHNSGTVL